MNDKNILTSIIKESLYRMAKKEFVFTPFNYYKVFTEVALEYGMTQSELHQFLYGDIELDAKDIEEMRKKVLNIATNIKDVTVDVEKSIEKTENENKNILENISKGKIDENIVDEIEKIKYINISLRSELESARKVLEKQRLAIESIKELSLRDHLTGLYLRRYMESKLSECIYNYKRYKKKCSIIMADLDDFKEINDMYGHSSGDIVLRDFALLLEKITRQSDVCIRYGGDEFIILLPEITLEDAVVVAKKIQNSLDNLKFKKGNMEFSCSVSMGVTSVKDNDNLESVLDRVDEALYKTKREGKSGITVL